MILFHYTCDHGRRALGDAGQVMPAAMHEPGVVERLPDGYRFLSRLAWFTDLAVPDREALGLTGTLTPCDRARYRYRVVEPHTAPIDPWLDVLPHLPGPAVRMAAYGGLPRHWFVSAAPVDVVLDEDYLADSVTRTRAFGNVPPWPPA